MQQIWHWGAELIIAVQTIHNPALDALFNAITSLGSEEFYVVLLPVLYWCVDKWAAQRLAYLLLLSTYANELIKNLLRQPRPFQYDSRVLKLDKMPVEQLGYGFPSLHSQSAVTVWGYLALVVRRRWMWILSTLLMVLIPFSRIYLGVHFPTDVLGGLVLGVIWLGLFCRLESRLTAWLSGQTFSVQLGLATVIPTMLLLVHSSDEAVAVLGTILGLGIGIVFESRWVRFRPDGLAWARVGRLVLGAVVLIALREGLKIVFPVQGEALYIPLRAARYALVGLWVALGAPWLFVHLRLAAADTSTQLRLAAAHGSDELSREV
jgi:membrane-associated phospholipid phosphatase